MNGIWKSIAHLLLHLHWKSHSQGDEFYEFPFHETE